jgi:sulfur carrier protein ThiS
MRSFMLPERPKVKEALTAANIETKLGDQLMVNGKPVRDDYQLREGDELLVSPPIDGGNVVP